MNKKVFLILLGIFIIMAFVFYNYKRLIVTPENISVTNVVVSKDLIDVTLGDKLEALMAQVYPENATDKSIIWSSDNDSIATVSSSGIITLISYGTVTIKATSISNPDKFDTIVINISKAPTSEPVIPIPTPKIIEVTNITLNKTSTILMIGGKLETLIAKVYPEDATDKSITWSSSDNSVATVSSLGTITPISGGTITIKATSNLSPTKYAVCTVMVMPKYSLDETIKVDADYPPGAVAYADYYFKDSLERIDLDVKINEMDTSKDIYLQFYESDIGKDHFYFGVQNRVNKKDQMLIFSRWGTRDVSNLEVNTELGGVYETAGYEGDFISVRVPNFKLTNGNYTFSIIKDKEDSLGTWYKYVVKNRDTNIETWGGSLRFDFDAKIRNSGGTWLELFGPAWSTQTYRYLPNWNIDISSKGNLELPISVRSNYKAYPWGDHIPMKNISYDKDTNIVNYKFGPKVERKNIDGVLF